jgi:archaeal arginyl aminopeptidase
LKDPGKRAVVLTADKFEDMEVFFPLFRLLEMGWKVDIAAPNKRRISGEHGYTLEPATTIGEVEPALASADVVKGRRLTSYWHDGVPEDVKAAGGKWEDEEVVVDGNLITSRWPMDLPAFMREIARKIDTK